jgi:hypothetical protein
MSTLLDKKLKVLVNGKHDLSQSDIPQMLQNLINDDNDNPILITIATKLTKCKSILSAQRITTLFINCIKSRNIHQSDADEYLLRTITQWIVKSIKNTTEDVNDDNSNTYIAIWYQLMDVLFAVAKDKTSPHYESVKLSIEDAVRLLVSCCSSKTNHFLYNTIENAISYMIHQQGVPITLFHFRLLLNHTNVDCDFLTQFLIYHGGVTWLNKRDNNGMNALEIVQNTLINTALLQFKSGKLYEWYMLTSEEKGDDAMKLVNEFLIEMMKCNKSCNETFRKFVHVNNQIQEFLLDRAEHSKMFNPCLVYFDTNMDFGNVCFNQFKEIYLGEECVKTLKEQPICTTKNSGLLYTRPANEKKVLMKGKQDGTKLMQRLKDNALKSL